MAKIYVFASGRYDQSRWLTINRVDEERILLELSELCIPGHVSCLTQIVLDLAAALSALRNGAVQVTGTRGYFLLRRVGDLVNIEFRSHDDVSTCRVSLLCDDLSHALGAGTCESRAVLR